MSKSLVMVDKKCEVCGKVVEFLFRDETDVCCGKVMNRIYGYNRDSEFVPGLYSHFTHDDIYLESREDYNRACKEYNVEQMGGKGSYQKM